MSDTSVIGNKAASAGKKPKRYRFLSDVPTSFLVDQTDRKLLSRSELRLGTAIGLALQGLGKAPIQIDHLEENQSPTKRFSSWWKGAPKNHCWGIDIGYDSLKAVHLSLMNQGKKIVLEEAYCIRYSQDIILDEVIKRERIEKTLASFSEKHSLSKASVCVGLSTDDCLFSSINLPAIDKKRTEAAIYHEVRYHLPSTDYLYMWTHGIAGRSCTPEGNWSQTVLVSLVRQELMRNFMRVLKDNSIQPKMMIPNAVANLNYLLMKRFPDVETDPKKGTEFSFESTNGSSTFRPFASVDIGAGSTEVSIYSLSKIMIGTIPIGGNAFTEKICRGKKIVWKAGESLKRSSLQQSAQLKLAGIWQEIGVKLSQQIRHRCEQFEKQADRIEALYLTGGASQLKGLQQLFHFLDHS
jgi:Tfp pilus assembly PilM family ATPase